MHVPEHHREERPDILRGFIHTHPLGALVCWGSEGLVAHHLPFELLSGGPGQERLVAHVARANPVWRQVAPEAQVLVIFQGVQGYISPSWYASKRDTHRQVPTWNYEAVHVRGRITVHDDRSFVRDVVSRLTRQHEARESTPWRLVDMPPHQLDDMLARIVGLEIRITSLQGQFRLSQNKRAEDRQRAIQCLLDRGQVELASRMSRP